MIPPTIYAVAAIGAGKLSVMAKPVSGEFVDDEFAGLRKLGVDHVVSLLEPEEQRDVGLANEAMHCANHGMRYSSFPITDREVPRRDAALAFAAALHRDVSGGEHAVIHCRAGIGRTGIMASALLILDGYSPARAIHEVSFARGSLIPDTEEQQRWIELLADALD